jgi:catechol 2,3-dioxygenase-like lactoylglutathione lyase family enzyme
MTIMQSTRGIVVATVSSLALLASLATECLAQPTDAKRGAVLGTGIVTGFVENMDRSLAFYHDAFGMEVPALPESGARPYNPSNSGLFAMFDIAGAKERHQHATAPGTDVRYEIMEIQNVEHRTLPLRIQDPGALTLVFTVRDVDAVLAQARKAGAETITPHGAIVKLADGTKAVLIRDIDGRPIELRESAATDGQAGASPITGMRISIAVQDMARTLKVYRDTLGFSVEEEKTLGGDPQLRALTGLAKAQFARSVVRAPGSKLAIEFVEYRGVDRKPLKMRIQDRGAARLQVRADSVEPLVAKMRAAGLKVASKGGVPAPIPPNFMGALVADPNNFFLTPFAPCDGCAPRLVPEKH